MTKSTIPIYQGQDYYVPDFDVVVDNKRIARNVRYDVMQLSYRDSIENVDSVELTINNWDADKKKFKYLDTDFFDPGKEIEVSMGYRGKTGMTKMIRAAITSMRPNFPSSGLPTLSVSGLNLLHKLRKKQRSESYPNMNDSQIAKKIAGTLGVDIVTDPTAEAEEEIHKYLLQDNLYDIMFLMLRARAIGYELYVEEGEKKSILHFEPSQAQSDVIYKLTWGRSLIQFQPNINIASQVKKVTVRSWDAKNAEKIEETVDHSELGIRVMKDAKRLKSIEAAFSEKEDVVTRKSLQSAQAARNLARRRMERIVKKMITASGSTLGLPGLRAGTMICIDGFGAGSKSGESWVDGKYFVTSTTHTMGESGYTTQFECRKESV